MLSLILFCIWVFEVYEEGTISANITPVFRLLVFSGGLGAGITIVGMEYFLFRFDTSHPLKQILWFVIMLIPLFGAALYCFVVYSRSEVLKQPCSHQRDHPLH